MLLGLAAVAESLRLVATGDPVQVFERARRDDLLSAIVHPQRLWQSVLEGPLARSYITDVLVGSITAGAIREETAVLEKLGIGSLEAEIERLFDRLHDAFRRIVRAAIEASQIDQGHLERRTTERGVELRTEILSAAAQVARRRPEPLEGPEALGHRDPFRRVVSDALVLSSTVLLVDGLRQIRVQSVEISQK